MSENVMHNNQLSWRFLIITMVRILIKNTHLQAFVLATNIIIFLAKKSVFNVCKMC